MVEGRHGEIWFSSRAGLLKWSPDTRQRQFSEVATWFYSEAQTEQKYAI